MYVKPAEGRALRDPQTRRLLPAESRQVPDDIFWQRALADGDVVACDPPEEGMPDAGTTPKAAKTAAARDAS